MRKILFLLIIINFILISSCNQSVVLDSNNSEKTPKSLEKLTGTLWKWYSYETKSGKKILVKDSTFLIFLINFVDDNNLFGIAGCNNYCSHYRIIKDTLIFDSFFTSDVGGPLVSEFNTILYYDKTFKATDSILEIFTANNNVSVLTFKRYNHNPQKHFGEILRFDLDSNGIDDFVFEHFFRTNKGDTIGNVLSLRAISDCGANINKLENGRIIDNHFEYYNYGIDIAELEKSSLGWEELWNHLSEIYSFNIPLRITINGEYHYGWVNVSINPETGMIILNDYSYNPKPNEAIIAGNKMK